MPFSALGLFINRGNPHTKRSPRNKVKKKKKYPALSARNNTTRGVNIIITIFTIITLDVGITLAGHLYHKYYNVTDIFFNRQIKYVRVIFHNITLSAHLNGVPAAD